MLVGSSRSRRGKRRIGDSGANFMVTTAEMRETTMQGKESQALKVDGHP